MCAVGVGFDALTVCKVGVAGALGRDNAALGAEKVSDGDVEARIGG